MTRRVIGLLGLFACSGGVTAGVLSEKEFLDPPALNRPACYGFIMPLGTVPDDALVRDMEEFKEKGITAVLLYFPYVGTKVVRSGKKLVYGEIEHQIEEKSADYLGQGVITEEVRSGNAQWSDGWKRTVKLAAKEGGRLGLDVGISVGGVGCELGGLPVEYAEKTIVWSCSTAKGGAVADINLPISKDAIREKNGTPLFYRDIAVMAVPANRVVQPEQVFNLSDRMDAAGKVDWKAPEGEWTVLRFGYTAPPSHYGKMLDHLSAEAMDKKWEVTMAKLLKDMTPEERKGLKFVECDSYEGGKQTWTPKFAEEFKRRRGYDIKQWMPVLAGVVIGDKRKSACFQRDYGLTISDLYADNHYARHTTLARAEGLKFYSEAAGPNQKQTDMLKSLSRCDVSMGEFWMPGTHRGVSDDTRFLLRDAAAAAHGYGTGDVFCEAFTGGNDPWRESPFRMKPCGDQAFCDGMTRPCIHGGTISIWPDAKPGLVYWAGVYCNRNTTWWNHVKPYFDYLGRCSYMLRKGVFAPDVAYYTGEGIGRSVYRKAVGPKLGGRHDYDRVNTEILDRMSVRDSRIVLPDGLSYRLLVLAMEEPLRINALRKIVSLVEEGAIVLGSRPVEPYGLLDDPVEFAALADRVWGAGKLEASGSRKVGKGRVVWGKPVLQALADDDVQPDFECSGVSSNGVIDWIHRKAGDSDIYFVCSRWAPVEQVECAFRGSGRIPELWDPVTGLTCEAKAFRQDNGRTIVPLRFDPCGSVFVVFRKPVTRTALKGKNWREYRSLLEIEGPWEVQFDEKWFYDQKSEAGGQETARAVFDKLEDWAKRPDEAIRYYSGSATYRKTFNIEPEVYNLKSALYLDLGKVEVVAEVRLNGKYLGKLWTRPFMVDVADSIRAGENHLEVQVANLWPNRLTGDTFLPKEKRRTRTNMTKYTQSSQLLPSGLIGPVRLMAEELQVTTQSK